MSQKKIDQIAIKTLGKNTGYPRKYNKSLLLPIPRSYNREKLNYDVNTLGVDMWRAFEVSCIDKNNLPFFGILHFTVPSDSINIVESKSLKLYLNSLSNFQVKSSNVKKGLLKIIQRDLQEILMTDINIDLHEVSDKTFKFPNEDYEDISVILDNKVSFQAIDSFESVQINNTQKISSHWLKSRCRITDQPDWGNIYIEISGKNGVSVNSLASFLIKNHNLNHFHEEMCELIYTKILDEIKPEKLTIACLYTRRGGIDINPVRSNDRNSQLYKFLGSNQMFRSTFRQ